MKNICRFFVIFLLVILQSSCERDEICLEDTTPKLIIRFYNESNQNQIKSVIRLKVNIEGIDEDFTNETITNITDSIAIPLKVAEDRTRFILTIQGDESEDSVDNMDTISVRYNQQDIFVSRSCGYKTVFNEAETDLVEDDDNWIKGLEATNEPLQIIDESTAHVKIYH